MSNKFVLLGLDGATFEMLDPFLEGGHLPVLASLLEGGARGILRSTVPPFTCPAWPTMYTGRNPGAHGVTSFRLIEPGSVSGRSATLRDIACPRIWTLLNEAGLRTGIFNVPVTYPADPVEGFMVSGFVTPPGAAEAVQPERLRGPFAEAHPHYECNGPENTALPFETRKQRRQFMQAMEEAVAMRLAATEWLLEREPVDFLWVVFETIDRISHKAYAYLTPKAPHYETADGREVRELALEVLQAQDRAMGRILDLMGPDPHAMVVSDHGFMYPRKKFCLHDWLVAKGLMVPKGIGLRGGLGSPLKALTRRVIGREASRRLMGFLRAKHLVRLPARDPRSATWDAEQEGTWDWERSETWLGPAMEYGVRINGRYGGEEGGMSAEEANRVVQAVVDGLQSVADPETDAPLFDVVGRREQLYDGPFMQRAPEVLFSLRNGYRHATIPTENASEDNGWLVPMPERWPRGVHDMAGVFALGGPGVAQEGTGRVDRVGMADIVPTILYAMGLAVPEELEGRVLEEVFTDQHRAANPIERVERTDRTVETGSDVPTYSDEEEDLISKRLEDLGYL